MKFGHLEVRFECAAKYLFLNSVRHLNLGDVKNFLLKQNHVFQNTSYNQNEVRQCSRSNHKREVPQNSGIDFEVCR